MYGLFPGRCVQISWIKVGLWWVSDNLQSDRAHVCPQLHMYCVRTTQILFILTTLSYTGSRRDNEYTFSPYGPNHMRERSKLQPFYKVQTHPGSCHFTEYQSFPFGSQEIQRWQLEGTRNHVNRTNNRTKEKKRSLSTRKIRLIHPGSPEMTPNGLFGAAPKELLAKSLLDHSALLCLRKHSWHVRR